MEKLKAIAIFPYVFHMYHTHEVLLLGKKKEYRIAKALLKYNVEPEEEGKPEASNDLERESLNSREVQEIQAQEYTRLKKSPCGKRGSPAGKGPMQQ